MLELSIKLGNKQFGFTIGGKKAFNQTIDPNNELYKQLYQMLGTGFGLPQYNIEDAITKGYLVNPHLYSVINKKIKPAAKVPFYLYEQKPDKLDKVKEYKSALRIGDYEKADFYQKKAFDLIEIKGLTELLQNPNENESFSEWMESMLGYYNLTGNGYVYGLTSVGFEGQFTKIYTMPSQLTQIITGNTKDEIIKGYSVNWFGTWNQPIDKQNVCHIKMWNPNVGGMDVGLYGLSPLSALCSVNENSVDNFNAQMRLLKNGYPAGILSSDSERGMTSDQAKDAQDRLDENYSGVYHKRLMITSAALKWQALGLNSIDLQLLDGNKANLETIARCYNVPLPLLVNDASTMDNMNVSLRSLWDNSIIPDLSRIRDDVFNKWLLPYWIKKTGKKLYIDYDLTGIEALKKDDKLVLETIAMEIENGIITPNQAREKRGYELVTDPLMDKYYLKNGLRPIDQPYQQPQTPQGNGK